MKPLQDQSGLKYGRLTVLSEAPSVPAKNGRNIRMAYCACDCGNFGRFTLAKLRHGHTQSCGCLALASRTKHGFSKSLSRLKKKTYTAWQDVKNRCFNPNLRNYYLYGGRGITMCQPWRESFEAFVADVGMCEDESLSLGRIDNSRGYEPGNVRWETIDQQANNKRRNRPLTFNGKTQNLMQWCREMGWPNQTLTSRLRKGWSVERALSTPRTIDRTAKRKPKQVS